MSDDRAEGTVKTSLFLRSRKADMKGPPGRITVSDYRICADGGDRYQEVIYLTPKRRPDVKH